MDRIQYHYEINKGTTTGRGRFMALSEKFALRSMSIIARKYGVGAHWRVWSGKWEKKGRVA